MKKWIILATALLAGCSGYLKRDAPAPVIELNTTVIEPVEVPQRSNGILSTQPTPPAIAAYEDVRNNRTAFNEYVDDYNWYVAYTFAYTKVLNEYALARGWRPPDNVPICKFVELPSLKPFPKFVPSTDPAESLHQFEWELVDYIQRIRNMYEGGSQDVEDAKVFQRFMCLY